MHVQAVNTKPVSLLPHGLGMRIVLDQADVTLNVREECVPKIHSQPKHF